MSLSQRMLKRSFDLVSASFGLALLWPVILATWIMAGRDTGGSGFFSQTRIGRHGEPFQVIKLRTMYAGSSGTTVTTTCDPRITPLGAKFRRWKLDELPQLWNVFKGEMSFVGPRPDVPGFLDQIEHEDRIILELRPGITGPATLKYRHEEKILAVQTDPERYNAEVIWPDKVRLNKDYAENWSFQEDLCLIVRTILGENEELMPNDQKA